MKNPNIKFNYRRKDIEITLEQQANVLVGSFQREEGFASSKVMIQAYAYVRNIARKEGIDTKKYDDLVERKALESGNLNLQISGEIVRWTLT